MLSLASLLYSKIIFIFGVYSLSSITPEFKVVKYSTKREHKRFLYWLKDGTTTHYGVFLWRLHFQKCNLTEFKPGFIRIKSMIIFPDKTRFLSQAFEKKIKSHETQHMIHLLTSIPSFEKLLKRSCFQSKEVFEGQIKNLFLSVKYKDILLDLKTSHGLI